MMLRRVIIEIEDQTEAQVLEEQIQVLKESGLQAEHGRNVPESERENVSETGQELVVTDDPERIWKKYGQDCCILLYLTEANHDKWWKGITYAVISVRGLNPEFLEQVYRRHIGAPWDILETERLLIREMTEEDLDDLYRIHDQPGIEGFVAPLESDREKQKEILHSYIRKVYPVFGFGMWMIIEKGTGRSIGRAGLQMEKEDCPELGFIIEASAQRKGYCMEACRAVLKYGLEELGMEKICAVVTEKNLPSRSFCRRLGGKEEVRDGQHLFFWSTMSSEQQE